MRRRSASRLELLHFEILTFDVESLLTEFCLHFKLLVAGNCCLFTSPRPDLSVGPFQSTNLASEVLHCLFQIGDFIFLPGDNDIPLPQLVQVAPNLFLVFPRFSDCLVFERPEGNDEVLSATDNTVAVVPFKRVLSDVLVSEFALRVEPVNNDRFKMLLGVCSRVCLEEKGELALEVKLGRLVWDVEAKWNGFFQLLQCERVRDQYPCFPTFDRHFALRVRIVAAVVRTRSAIKAYLARRAHRSKSNH